VSPQAPHEFWVLTSHFGESLIWGPKFIADCRTAGGFGSRWLIFCLTDIRPQTRGAEPQMMSKSRGESLFVWPLDSGRTAARTWRSSSFWGVESEGRFDCVTCICTCMLRVRLLSPHLSAERPVCPRSHWLALQKCYPRQYAQCWILPKRWKEGEKKNERRLMCMCVRMPARDGSCSKPCAWVLTPCVKRH